ncbi:MAG: ATP-binding protein [Bacteroidetes bacterium]|nr:ATP-binding protein [Bacteroidota bacterium]
MLVQFSVRNFKTFKEKAILNLVASNYDKETREIENIKTDDDFNLRIVKSAVLYGANASGKSKFIEALRFMKEFAIKSSKDSQKGDSINVEPFKLESESEKDSSEFEVIFIFKKEMYRYGFEVTKEKVISEWLYHKPKTKEIELFYREKQKFDIHERNFNKGTTLVKEELVRDNALMLSVAAQFNDKSAGKVLNWFKGLGIISGLDEDGYQGFTMSRTESPKHKEQILELLKAADLGIKDITLEPLDITKLPKQMPKEIRESLEKQIKEENAQFVSDVLTTHRKYNRNKKYVGDIQFSLEDEESSGTKKFFALTGPVLDTIENGSVLVVDELDSKLHPNLVCRIVSIFNSKILNPKDAQLIFNTHDTNLLSSGLFRRDQIWFTEKDKYGSSKLFSLADFKSEVRKTDNFENNYIRGKYGAIPYLGDFDNFINSDKLLSHENER